MKKPRLKLTKTNLTRMPNGECRWVVMDNSYGGAVLGMGRSRNRTEAAEDAKNWRAVNCQIT